MRRRERLAGAARTVLERDGPLTANELAARVRRMVPRYWSPTAMEMGRLITGLDWCVVTDQRVRMNHATGHYARVYGATDARRARRTERHE